MIAEAKLSDLPRLLEMVKDYHAFDHLEFDPETIARLLTDLISKPDLGRVYVILNEEKTVIGYTLLTFGFSLEYQGRNAFIDELYLIEKYRNRGLGQKVIRLLQTQARSLGLRALHLEVERKNPNAIALYKKMNFKDQDRLLMTHWI